MHIVGAKCMEFPHCKYKMRKNEGNSKRQINE